jgi:hypothetical protein
VVVKRRTLALTAAIAVSGTLITACGGAQKSAVRSPVSPHDSTPAANSSTTGSPSPTSSPSGYASPYLDAFERFWVSYARADRSGDPTDPQLSTLATDSALAKVQGWVRSDAARGVMHKGTWRFRSVHATANGSSAQVAQCMDFSAWPVVASADGRVVERYPAWSESTSARMRLIDGQWRVSELTLNRSAC